MIYVARSCPLNGLVSHSVVFFGSRGVVGLMGDG